MKKKKRIKKGVGRKQIKSYQDRNIKKNRKIKKKKRIKKDGAKVTTAAYIIYQSLLADIEEEVEILKEVLFFPSQTTFSLLFAKSHDIDIIPGRMVVHTVAKTDD